MLHLLGFYLILIKFFTTTHSISNCNEKLLENYTRVPDSSFSSTSFYFDEALDFSAKASRMVYGDKNAWCPLKKIFTELKEYLEIDLGRITVLAVIRMKGRFANGEGQEFLPYYRIEYSRENGDWRNYRIFLDKSKRWENTLKGLINAYDLNINQLLPPIIARRIRIYPYSPNQTMNVCMKIELVGCDYKYNLLEYKVQQGSKRPNNRYILKYPFTDWSYDMQALNKQNYKYLTKGLGLLADMDKPEGFRSDKYVGWHRQIVKSNDHVKILFKFSTKTYFSGVKIYSLSNASLPTKYFSKLEILLSDFNPESESIWLDRISITDAVSQFNRKDHSLSVNLLGKSAKYILIKFYFNTNWLMLSEIEFGKVSNKDKLKGQSSRKPIYKSVSRSDYNVHHNNTSHVTPGFRVTTVPTTNNSSTNSKELIYMLIILLCLLVGVICTFTVFWIIIRRRTMRKKNLKKQALALCSQGGGIGVVNGSAYCVSGANTTATAGLGNYLAYCAGETNRKAVRPLMGPNGGMGQMNGGPYHAFTVDRCTYHMQPAYSRECLDSVGSLSKMNGNCNFENVYSSIAGSDNESTLSPEYASAVVKDPFQSSSNHVSQSMDGVNLLNNNCTLNPINPESNSTSIANYPFSSTTAAPPLPPNFEASFLPFGVSSQSVSNHNSSFNDYTNHNAPSNITHQNHITKLPPVPPSYFNINY